MSLVTLIDDCTVVFLSIRDIIECLPTPLVLLAVSIFGTFLVVKGFRLFKDW